MKFKKSGKFWKKVPSRLRKHWRLILIAAVVMSFGALVSIFLLKTTSPIAVRYLQQAHAVNQPVVIQLNQKLAEVNVKAIELQPRVEGTWTHVPGQLLTGDAIKFTPKTYLKTNTQYDVKLGGLKRMITGDIAVERTSFQTETAPRIESVTADRGKVLPADAGFEVRLSSANRGLRNLELRTTPAIELIKSSKDDTTFTWRPSGPWPQGTQIAYTIVDTKNDDELSKGTITIAAEPVVATPVKATYFTDQDVADIVFAHPIDTKTTAKIRFNVEGKGDWLNPTTYRFKPKVTAPGTTYNYTVESGLRSIDGGILINTHEGVFQTTGAVAVSSISPSGNGLAQAKQDITFRFDQLVDKASAEERFSISHGTVVQKRWSGNAMTVTVQGLGFSRTVVASVAAGVKNAAFGLPSARAFSHSFSTENRTQRLNVPFYRQQHSATCAVASLRMALAYRGIASAEMDIVGRMGYQPRSADKSTDPMTWDDPAQMFVGSVDGNIRNGTGAGPDAPPVAKAAQSYGRGAQAVTGISTGWIAEQIYAGHPVIMFGATSGSNMVTWQLPSGGTTTMNLTSHATVVTGVTGEPSNPIGFWVSDPLSGGNSYWSAAAVASNIARDPSRQAVVIY